MTDERPTQTRIPLDIVAEPDPQPETDPQPDPEEEEQK